MVLRQQKIIIKQMCAIRQNEAHEKIETTRQKNVISVEKHHMRMFHFKILFKNNIIPYQRFLLFSLMFQHKALPIVGHDLDTPIVVLFVYHLNHTYFLPTKMVCFHRF